MVIEYFELIQNIYNFSFLANPGYSLKIQIDIFN